MEAWGGIQKGPGAAMLRGFFLAAPGEMQGDRFRDNLPGMDRVIGRRLFPPRHLVGLLAAATAVAFVSTGQTAAYLTWADRAVPWVGLFKARLVDWYLYALFVPFLYHIAVARPTDGKSWRAALPLHIVVGLACALTKEILFTIVAGWFRPGVYGFAQIVASDYLNAVLVFWSLIFCLHLYASLGRRPQADGFGPAPDRFVASVANGYRVVPADEVEWIDAQGNYAQLNTAVRAHLIRETMTSLERRLGDRFLRVHRSAIVNRSHVRAIEPLSHGVYAIRLSSGARVVTGRSYNSNIRLLIR